MTIGIRLSEFFQSATLIAAGLLLASCARDGRNTIDAAICEQALSSFDILPIAPQTLEQKLELIELIKIEQERSFASGCERIPDWRARFDRAYLRTRDAEDARILEAEILEENSALLIVQE